MNILVGSIQQETNSFSPLNSGKNDFFIEYGEKMLQKVPVFEYFSENGVNVIPTIFAHAVPSGCLKKQDFLEMAECLFEEARKAKPLDGIWLYLHGALEVEEIGSGEAYILKELRTIVGEKTVISTALDFHANNDSSICHNANIICGYRTAPHEDMKETQLKAARLLLECINKQYAPKPVMISIPVIISGDTVITSAYPYAQINRRLDEIEQDSRMLSISLFNGQNWVDSKNNRASVIAIAKNCEAAAESYALEIAESFYGIREKFDFQVSAFEPEKALRCADEIDADTVFVSDSGDNTTAGAGGMSSGLLALALKMGVDGILFGGICDTAVYKLCMTKAVNDIFSFELGEEKTVCQNAKLLYKGNIKSWDGEDGGGAVVTQIDKATVIITQKRCAFISSEIFESVGIDISDYHIVVVKLGYLYPDLQKKAKHHIIAKTNGSSCVDITKINFTKIKRPCWPLDSFEWSAYQNE